LAGKITGGKKAESPTTVETLFGGLPLLFGGERDRALTTRLQKRAGSTQRRFNHLKGGSTAQTVL